MLTVTMVYIAVITTSCTAAQGCSQFWFILSNNIALHCFLSGEYPNICIYALNNIPAPALQLSNKSCIQVLHVFLHTFVQARPTMSCSCLVLVYLGNLMIHAVVVLDVGCLPGEVMGSIWELKLVPRLYGERPGDSGEIVSDSPIISAVAPRNPVTCKLTLFLSRHRSAET